MAAIPAKLIEDTARELMARAAIDIPPDYREGVRLARDREKNRLARFVLDEMLDNWDIATAERLLGDRLRDVRDTVDKFRTRGEGPPMGQGPQGRKAAGRKKREST